MFDCLVQSGVGRGPVVLTGGAEVIQRPQDVIPPAMGVKELEEAPVRGFAGREAAEQPSLQ